jgi:hypothetical protein
MSEDGPEWFAPKRFGYGSGLPIAWQGWAVTVGFTAIIFVALLVFRTKPIALFAILVPAFAALMIITARTTRGGWRWRWGEDD